METLVILLAFGCVFAGAAIGCFGFILIPPLVPSWPLRAISGLFYGAFMTGVGADMIRGDTPGLSIVLGILLLLAWVAGWTYRSVLRLYYLLTPHPAARLVDDALYRNTPLDADAFTLAMREGAGVSEYERAARAEQVAALTARWRQHEQALRVDEARILESERRSHERDNELLRAQTDALEAAIAHEKAAARLEELQRVLKP